MSAHWIDFRALREKVNMLDVLRHYGVVVKIRGDQATGLCPLPRHPSRTDGKPRTASLSVNLARNCFKCFGCQARGNTIDYVCYSEGLDPADPQQVRQAALKLTEWFDQTQNVSAHQSTLNATKPRCANTTASQIDRAEGGTAQTSEQRQFTQASELSQEELGEIIVNPPLGFTLQHLDPSHPYLIARGFTPETIKHFGLGFCSRGLLKGRIAIPLHDPTGTLIGYAGRIVEEAAISDDCPKYLLPGRRKREGVTTDFRKSRFLYNGFSFAKPVDDLIVCEGFPATWWLHQAGYPAVVGLMGSDCSEEQSRLVSGAVRPDGRVWIFSDADSAGDHCADKAMSLIGRSHFVRRVVIGHGQPTNYTTSELSKLLWG